MLFLFCSDPQAPRQPDSAFASEAEAVQSLDVALGLIDFEALAAGDEDAAVRRVSHRQDEIAVYRGWMLKPEAYQRLFTALLQRGVRLINDPEAYVHTHHLPASYSVIEGETPRSVWFPVDGPIDLDAVMALLQPFGDAPVLLKDYVKSQKHAWKEACFIPRASDRDAVERVVRRFVALQDEDLNVGLVFRAFADLAPAGAHPKSGMPLAREHRLFFLDGSLVAALRYWDEAIYAAATDDLPMDRFSALAARVKSRFFTMDVAELREGGFTVIELGDAQVSGLPDHADRVAFHREIARRLG
jgi:hypothetical protein